MYVWCVESCTACYFELNLFLSLKNVEKSVKKHKKVGNSALIFFHDILRFEK